MKNMKFFVISGMIILLFGICAFCVSYIDSKSTKSETKSQLETINTVEAYEPELVIDGNVCARMYLTETTKTKDGVIVDKYQEYVFGCFCEGSKKALEGFEYKTSNSIAEPICDKQCGELCKNRI